MVTALWVTRPLRQGGRDEVGIETFADSTGELGRFLPEPAIVGPAGRG